LLVGPWPVWSVPAQRNILSFDPEGGAVCMILTGTAYRFDRRRKQ
jgi:hypothetical protein